MGRARRRVRPVVRRCALARSLSRHAILRARCARTVRGAHAVGRNRGATGYGRGRITILPKTCRLSSAISPSAVRSSGRGTPMSPTASGRCRATPQLAADIRSIVEPHTDADAELKSARRYCNLAAGEVRAALIANGYAEEDVPSERTMRDILNRMNYRLKRIQKGKPLKKTNETDATFANVKHVREQARKERERAIKRYRRERILRRLAIWGAVLVGVGAVAWFIYQGQQRDQADDDLGEGQPQRDELVGLRHLDLAWHERLLRRVDQADECQ